MSGVITTGSNPRLLWPGIRAIWGQTFKEHPPEFNDLYDVETSDKAYEIDQETTGFPLLPAKPQGTNTQFFTNQQGWTTTYVPQAYSGGFAVTYEEVRDNLYAEVAPQRAKSLAFAGRQTIEVSCAYLYNYATSTAAFAFPDGQPLLSTAHVFSTGVPFSNKLQTPADITYASLNEMATMIMLAKNGEGHAVALVPQSLHVHASRWANTIRLLQSDGNQFETIGNAPAYASVNPLKVMKLFPKGVKINHYLTDPSAWFVRTDAPEGAKFFWRDKPDLKKDNNFGTRDELASTYFRFSRGFTNPLSVYGNKN